MCYKIVFGDRKMIDEKTIKRMVKKEAVKVFSWAVKNNKNYGSQKSVFEITRCVIRDGNAHISINYYPTNLYMDNFMTNTIFKYTQYFSKLSGNILELSLFISKKNLDKLQEGV